MSKEYLNTNSKYALALKLFMSKKIGIKGYLEALGGHIPYQAFPPIKALIKQGNERAKMLEPYLILQSKNNWKERGLSLIRTMVEKDLTLKEAAGILKITIDTANKDIANWKAHLNVRTTHGIIRECILLGYMTPKGQI